MIPPAVQAKLQELRDTGALPVLIAAFDEIAALAVRETARECADLCGLEYISSEETDGRLGEEDQAHNAAVAYCIGAIRAKYGVTK